jgi:hypothetical protein
MERTITFRWWISGNMKAKPKHEHESALERHAMLRIQDQVDRGFLSGELLEEFNNIEYEGHWEVSKRTNKFV